MCESANVSGTVTSQASGLPVAQGSKVVPSERFPLCTVRLTGSFTAGICARLMALHMMSFSHNDAAVSESFYGTPDHANHEHRPVCHRRTCEAHRLYIPICGVGRRLQSARQLHVTSQPTLAASSSKNRLQVGDFELQVTDDGST